MQDFLRKAYSTHNALAFCCELPREQLMIMQFARTGYLQQGSITQSLTTYISCPNLQVLPMLSVIPSIVRKPVLVFHREKDSHSEKISLPVEPRRILYTAQVEELGSL